MASMMRVFYVNGTVENDVTYTTPWATIEEAKEARHTHNLALGVWWTSIHPEDPQLLYGEELDHPTVAKVCVMMATPPDDPPTSQPAPEGAVVVEYTDDWRSQLPPW